MKKLLLIASALALSASAAGSARAALIAGWDHSPWAISGFLSLDGATLTDTLAASYSDLDPTFGAGAEAAAFGTLYLNGQFGSSATPLDGTDPYVPVTGSLVSNVNAPVNGMPAGVDVPFGSLTVLVFEGSLFANDLAMVALGSTQVVYGADLTSVPEIGSNWSLSFAGKTFAAGTQSLLGIEFSTDGMNYANIGQVLLTPVDTLFNVILGAGAADRAFVRFNLTSPGGAASPIIDNVAINATLQTVVPEPGTVLLLGAGLGGLALIGRRRD
jgi:hypothetical protein